MLEYLNWPFGKKLHWNVISPEYLLDWLQLGRSMFIYLFCIIFTLISLLRPKVIGMVTTVCLPIPILKEQQQQIWNFLPFLWEDMIGIDSD